MNPEQLRYSVKMASLLLGAVEVKESPMLKTRDAYWFGSGARSKLVVRTLECFELMMAGVVWHEMASDKCPTWTDEGGCLCDVEGSGR